MLTLLIDESLEVPGAGEPPKKTRPAPGVLERVELLEAMVLRIHGMVATVLSAHDKALVCAYKDLICHLPAKDIGTLEFDMPAGRMLAVKNARAAAMEAFLANKPVPA